MAKEKIRLANDADDVAEGDRNEIEKALQHEDEKYMKDVIKPRPDHKTETNIH